MQYSASQEGGKEGTAIARLEDEVAQAPTPVAQALALEVQPSDRRKRLRSKTPEPGDGHCQRQRGKRLSRKSSPSVERSGGPPAPASGSRASVGVSEDKRVRRKSSRVSEAKHVNRRSSRSKRATGGTHTLKAYRVTWAWKLSEMGFSDAQIDAATFHCSTQRQAIEWLMTAESEP